MVRREADGQRPARAGAQSPAVHLELHRADAWQIRSLLARPFPTNVRELDGLLWNAMMHSIVGGLTQIADTPSEPPVEQDPSKLTREQIEQALAHAEGVQDRAWRLLGLRNRYQLIRLLKKHGIG